MDIANPLPQTYYLDNFHKLLADVEARYHDLLTSEEAEFYRTFLRLPEPARCLYVRLISRKGPLFRRDKLVYAEIPDLDLAVQHLFAAGFLQIDPPVTLPELLALFTRAELAGLFASIPRSLRRPEFEQMIYEAQPDHQECCVRWYELLQTERSVLKPAHAEILECYRLLFFGNLGQDLTDFVLSDLGLVAYEPYELRGTAEAFRNRQELDDLLWAIRYRRQVDQALAESSGEALSELAALRFDTAFAPAQRQVSKALNALGRQLERNGELNAALAVFERSTQPPARERRVRILHALGDDSAALSLCESILLAPWNEEERTCALRMQQRCLRRLGRPQPAHKPPPLNVERICLNPADYPGQSVEAMALAHLAKELGQQGAYVENWLFNALFGLLFWEEIFASVEDAFYHPFQRGPRDLYETAFYSKRKDILAAKLDLVANPQLLQARIESCWRAKFGTANPFVHWVAGSENLLAQAVHCIPGVQLRRVFERMLQDLRNHCSGFPDLILFDQHGGYMLVEIKGPGDRLQDHQRRWLEFFAENAIPARVVHVDYTVS